MKGGCICKMQDKKYLKGVEKLYGIKKDHGHGIHKMDSKLGMPKAKPFAYSHHKK